MLESESPRNLIVNLNAISEERVLHVYLPLFVDVNLYIIWTSA